MAIRLFFFLIEGMIHREVPVKVKYALQVLGLALVFGLMIAVTYQGICCDYLNKGTSRFLFKR